MLVLALGARAAAGADAPVAAGGSVAAVAGHWQGTIRETGAYLMQGLVNLDLQIREDGTWSGKVGPSEASGTVRLDERGWLIVSGATRPTDRLLGAVVYWQLVGDSTRRWGQVEATFSGRPDHAMILLEKMP